MDSRSTRLARAKEALKVLVALLVAFCIWVPSIHFFFSKPVSNYRPPHGISTTARELAAAQTEVWSNPKAGISELKKLRAVNPEWDFMSRTYLVLSLANMALSDPSYRNQALKTMDTVLDDTLRHEREDSFYYYLLAYGRDGCWITKPPRSVFVDGEIALMLAARRMVEERFAYKPLLQQRVSRIIKQMSASCVLSAESYPDECWIFCNIIALASIRMSDVLDGTDHSAFLRSWVRTAKEKLIDHRTGVLISAYAVDGKPALCGSGAEGSSIWMACHMLQIIDPGFAKEQYRLAKEALAAKAIGFAYALEWPRGGRGSLDVDSGPIAPLLNVSPSSTGLATVAAAAFDDEEYLQGVFASIELGGLPARHNGQLRYCISNRVGDAVMLYAMTEGPLWNAVKAQIQKW